MSPSEKVWLFIGGLVPALLLGLMGIGHCLKALRRGEIQYRDQWWVRREEPFLFWTTTLFFGIGGLATVALTLWVAARIGLGLNPIPPLLSANHAVPRLRGQTTTSWAACTVLAKAGASLTGKHHNVMV